MGKLQVVVGGQFGSEAKGAVCGYLAQTEPKDLYAIRVGGPNAGHTVYDLNGKRHALRQVPVAAATNPRALLGIAAGSEVDLDVLEREQTQLGRQLRLDIDDQATIMQPAYEAEGKLQLERGIGSTGKGISTARAARMKRDAYLFGGDTDVAITAREWLADGGTVQVEGTQGYGLGLHAGWYPHCTSIDCRAIDMLSMAGLSPWDDSVTEFEVWVVFRTYPIRVAGLSGPLFSETTWASIGVEPEYTTVTNKERRVGEWDSALAKMAIMDNGGVGRVHAALMMFDYWHPGVKGARDPMHLDAEMRITLDVIGADLQTPIELVGTGPNSIIDLRSIVAVNKARRQALLDGGVHDG